MSALHPGTKRQLTGIALVLLSTVAIAIVPTAAKLAYEAGSNTLTVVTMRGVIAVALIAALIVVSGKGFRTTRAALKLSIISGLFYTAMSYGFLGSVAYIPVSFMVLIYFTHPILIAGIAHWQGKERLGSRKLVLAVSVFVGLAIVLGPDLLSLDPIGVALAVLAAVTVCGMILFNAKAQDGASSTLVNFYMTSVTVVIFLIVTTLQSDWSFPSNSLGWLGLVGAGVGLVVGLLAFFAAFRYIGPVRATMISNVEPLLGILFAVAVLGERLGLWQWAGALLVVTALVLFELPERRRETFQTR